MANKGTRRWLSLLGLTGVVAYCGVAYYNSDPAQAARRLPLELEGARQEGLVLDLAALQTPPIRDDENAAPAYRLAIQEAQTDYVKQLRDLGAGGNTTYSRRLDKELDDVQPLLADVTRGARKAHLDFGRDWTLGNRLVFSECSALRKLAFMLRLDAERRIARHDPFGALDRAETIASIGTHLGEEPTLIGAYMECSMRDDAAQVMEDVLAQDGHDASVRSRLRKCVTLLGPPPDLRHAMSTQLPSGLSGIGSLGSSSLSAARLGKLALFRDAYSARMVQYWRTIYRELPRDPYDFKGASAVLDRTAKRFAARGGLSDSLNAMILPNFGQATMAFALTEAHKRLIEGGLDLLDGKPAPVPKDPYTEAPLIVKQKDGRTIVYSVGPDQRDDGGVALKEMRGSGDIVIVLPKGHS